MRHNSQTKQNDADHKQLIHDQLTAFGKDLIALCTKHGIELEADDGVIKVSRKVVLPVSGVRWERLGHFSSVDGSDGQKADELIDLTERPW